MASGDATRAMYRAVWRTVAGIPPGRVLSYGAVARLAGYPRHARFVARALRAAPAGMELPWHRVVNAGGRISLPEGSPQAREQRDRLRAEGVVMVRGRIDMNRFGAHDALDAWLWGPPPMP